MTDRLFTRNFILICITSFAHKFSFEMLLTTAPLFIIKLGGQETEVGMLMAIVSGAALAVRPISGWAVGCLGRKITMLIGPASQALASASYLFAGSVSMVMAFRTLHGVSIGSFNIAAPILISEDATHCRRGEAIGYFSISQTLPQAIGPAIGLVVVNSWDFNLLFVLATGLSIAALISGAFVKDDYRPQPWRYLRWNMLFSLRVLRPVIVVSGISFVSGSIMSFIPLYGLAEGVSNPGFFFTIFATVMMLSRTVSGRLSDQIGRIAVIWTGILLITASLLVLVFSGECLALIISAIFLGAGLGSAYPALMALVIDIVPPDERGGAMSTFGIGTDIGIAVGSLVQGFIVEAWGFSYAFGLAAFLPLFSLMAYWHPKAEKT